MNKHHTFPEEHKADTWQRTLHNHRHLKCKDCGFVGELDEFVAYARDPYTSCPHCDCEDLKPTNEEASQNG